MNEPKYKHVTYGKGFVIKVDPHGRAADVLHNMITGGLLGGRSLDGVEIELLKQPDEATKALSRAMRPIDGK